MFTILIAVICLWLTYFYITRVYRTKAKMYQYKMLFEKAGFRVKLQPFRLYGSNYLKHAYEAQAKHGAPMYHFQKQLHDYDVVIDCIFNKPLIQLLSPQLNQSFFNIKYTELKKFQPIIANFQRILGWGMIFSEGQQWSRKRRVISQVFHYEFLNKLIPSISQTADQIFQEFERQYPQGNMNMLDTFEGITSTVITKCFFGSDVKQRRIEGKHLVNYITELSSMAYQQGMKTQALLFGVNFLKLGLREVDRTINRKAKVFKDIVRQIVDNKIKELKRINFKASDKTQKDIIEQLYIANSLGQKSTEDCYNIEEIMDEFYTFFIAGTDTTSHLSTMSVLYLQRNPRVKAKVMQQINLIIQADEDINTQNLKKLQYTGAVLKETMRIYGPSNKIFLRQTLNNVKLNNIPIDKGTVIFTEFTSNNHNPLYYKNPDEFRPQRWLQENKDMSNSYIYIPFSSGPRNCIGQHLANIQAKIILVKFLRRYEFKIENPDHIRLVYRFLVSPQRFITTVKRKELLQTKL